MNIAHRFSYQSLIAIILLLLSALVILIRLNSKPSSLVSAAWYDDRYTYRQLLSFTHNANLTFQSVGITISTSGLVSAGKMQSNCNDVRFTDPYGDVLPYSYTSGCNTATTYFNVGFNSIKNGTNYAYVYYGNPTALSASQTLTNYTTLVPSGGNPTAATEEAGGGPIAYWKMDEGVGSTLFDSSANNARGTMLGTSAPSWQPDSNCKFGKCLSFDGSNDRVTIPQNAIFNFVNVDFSFGVWFKANSWVNPSDDSRTFFSFATNGWNGWEIRYSEYTSSITLGGSGNERTIVNNLPSLGVWHHLFVTYSESGQLINAYVDGKLDKSTSINLDLTNASTTHCIGCHTGAGTGQVFDGLMDDFKIYRYARTSAQILADYNSKGNVKGSSVNLGVATTDTGPIAYWNFEEGVGTTAYDSSTNSNSAELKNSPTWSTGKYGKGIILNGTNQYLEAVHSSSLNIAGNISLETWVKFNSVPSTCWIIEKNGDSNQQAYYMALDNGGLGLTAGYHDGTTNREYYYPWSPTVGIWYHLVWTADGTNVNIYINGVLVKQTAQVGAVKSNSSGVLNLGRTTAGSLYLAGQIDETKIYNYARTQKQIVQDMNAGHPAGGSPVGSQVGYWKFDEGVGSTANNTGSAGSTINANLSSGTSAPTWSSNGVYHKALSFDGGDYLTVPDNTSLDLDQMTISTWIKISASNTNNGVIYKGSLASSQGVYSLGFFTGANTKIVFRLNGSTSEGSGQLTSATALNQNQWYHLVATYDRSNMKIYLNGYLDASNSYSTAVTADANPLYFGCYYSGSYCLTSGILDDIKIYNSALSSSEILIDYNRGQALLLGSSSTNSGGTLPDNSASRTDCVPGDTTNCAPPIARWTFEESSIGSSAYDISGNANNLILGTGTGTSSPTWVTGKTGKALSFDGNDYLLSGTTTLTNLGAGATVTLSGWIYPTSTAGTISLFTKGQSTNCFNYGIALISGVLSARNSNSDYSLTGTVSANQWSHVAVVFDSTGATGYINGQRVGFNASGGTTNCAVNNHVLGVRAYNALTSEFLSGRIDDFRIYPTARTQAQIAWEYNQGKPYVQYKLDECQGNTVYDSMGTGYTGTWSGSSGGTQTSTGSCTTNASTAWYNGRTGKLNSSMNFDGTDDYVAMGPETAYDFDYTQPLTISAWIKASTNNFGMVWSKALSTGSETGIYVYAAVGPPSNIYFSEINTSVTNQLQVLYTGDDLLPDVWNHVLITHNGSGLASGVKIYINGKEVSFTTQYNTLNASILNNVSPEIGANDGANNPFTGQIDDVRLYTYALTAAQVKTIYNNGSANFAPVTGAP